MSDEYLESVIALCNTGTLTEFEVTTNKDKYIWRIPYTVEKRARSTYKDKIYFYHYSVGIKDLCIAKGIRYRKYFDMRHKDCR